MRHTVFLLIAALPTALAGQQDPVQRLTEVLPPEVAEQVVSRVESAREMALPPQAVANLALEGMAKGRSAAEVLAAVDLLLVDMGTAREALASTGREPGAGEIEAATTALRMGIEGAAVAELARSGPPGRSLAIPLLVMGGLAQRGLPSDEALQAVAERLAAQAPDTELLRTFGAPGGAPGLAVGRGGVLPDVAGGRGGRGGGVDVPPGPPDGVGAGQGRGRGRGGPPTD